MSTNSRLVSSVVPGRARYCSARVRASATAFVIGARLLDQAAEIVVGDGLQVEVPDLLDQFGNHALGLRPSARAADAEDLWTTCVFFKPHSARSRHVNSSRLSVTTSSNVMFVKASVIGVLAQEARADDLVLQVDRPAAVTLEQDDVLAEILAAVDVVPRAIDDHHVGRLQRRGIGHLLHVVDRGDFRELDGKVGRPGDPPVPC